MPLAEFTALEALLNKRYSERFADPLSREHAEFANTYIFGLLEACIIRCAQAGDFTPSGPTVEGVIDELLAVLGTSTRELVCARHVSHLTTASGNEIQIGDITIVPQPEHSYGFLADRIRREIPGAPRAWKRDLPHPYDPPHALLIIRGTTDTVNPYVARDRLSAKLERFLLLARLMTAGTVQSDYEVSGMTTLIACMNPRIHVSGKGLLDTLVRRTVRLTGDEAAVFAAVSNMIDTVDIKRDGIVATSFDVALGKYNQSHNTGSPYEHLVDLATALEGVLIGAENEGEGLTLRLCTRAAALLARDDDPAAAVFNDVKELYGLRSNTDLAWPSLMLSTGCATWFGAPSWRAFVSPNSTTPFGRSPDALPSTLSSQTITNGRHGEVTGTHAWPRLEPTMPAANPRGRRHHLAGGPIDDGKRGFRTARYQLATESTRVRRSACSSLSADTSNRERAAPIRKRFPSVSAEIGRRYSAQWWASSCMARSTRPASSMRASIESSVTVRVSWNIGCHLPAPLRVPAIHSQHDPSAVRAPSVGRFSAEPRPIVVAQV